MISQITSTQNPRYKQVLKLQSNRGRRSQNRFIIFGQREVERALASSWQVSELWICRSWLSDQVFTNMSDKFSDSSLSVFEVPPELFERLEFGDRHEGIVAVADRPTTTLDRFSPRAMDSVKQDQQPLILVVEGIEKPGNLGAVLRSADGAGIHGVIHANPQTDFFHPNSIRASMGTVMHLSLAEASSSEVIDWLKSRDYEILLASLAGSVNYSSVDFTHRCAIVFGTEATGISEAWYQTAHRAIRLPMMGIADSLNISVAAAVMMYEARRQRTSFIG